MEGTTSRWKVERSVVHHHHHRGVCGEVVQEPLQQEPIKRLLGWRGGLLTSSGGRVPDGEVTQQGGEGEVTQCPLRHWRVQGGGRRHQGEVVSATWKALDATAIWRWRSEVQVVCQQLDRPM